MCLLTMTNDGGLQAVLDTSDIVSRELLAMSRPKRERRCPDREVDELAERTSNVLEVNDDSVRSGTKRQASRTLSELSYDFAPKKMNLSLLPSEELKDLITPLIAKMDAIDAAALLSLNPSSESEGARLDPDGSLTVPPIHDRITPTYADDGSNIVRYLHVKEVPNKYSAGIFVFPPNTEIPLHDHPDMIVLSRILYGELRVQSYDVLSPEIAAPTADRTKQKKTSAPSNDSKEHDQAVPIRQSVLRSPLKAIKDFVTNSFRDDEDSTHIETDSDGSDGQKGGENSNALQAKINQSPMGVEQIQVGDERINIISAPHVTCLYPKEGNCHAFVAGPHGAAVLDVLFPPYDADDNRDCTFFEAKETPAPEVKPEEELPREHSTQEVKPKEFTLTPINQPEHFHCLSGVYGRFTTCDEPPDQKEERDILGIDVSYSHQSVCTSS